MLAHKAPRGLLSERSSRVSCRPPTSCPPAPLLCVLQLWERRFLGFLLLSCSQAFLLNLAIFR